MCFPQAVHIEDKCLKLYGFSKLPKDNVLFVSVSLHGNIFLKTCSQFRNHTLRPDLPLPNYFLLMLEK